MRTRKILFLTAIVSLVFFVGAQVADAAAPQTNLFQTFNLGGVISLLVGTVLPLVVNFITKASMGEGVRFFLVALLSALSAVLGQWLEAINNHIQFVWEAAVLSALLTFATALLSHYGLLTRGTDPIANKALRAGVK